MNTVSMQNLWTYLQGLSLTASNRRWLANPLMETVPTVDAKRTSDQLQFPVVPLDYKPSEEVLSMTCGPFPEHFDVDKELKTMWEDRAR